MSIGLYFTYKSKDIKQFKQLVAVTVISTAVSGFSTIYDYDIWSVKKKIFIHTVCMFIVVYPALIYSGWFDISNIYGYIYAFISFACFGILFASIGYIISKYILKNVPKK